MVGASETGFTEEESSRGRSDHPIRSKQQAQQSNKQEARGNGIVKLPNRADVP